MYSADILASLDDTVLVLSLATLRIAVVFLMLPLFSKEGVPALVRNAMFLSLALLAIVVQPTIVVTELETATWATLFLKEALIGAVIGLFFGVFLWAFEAAGVVIDMQIGASFALYFDPIVGNEVTLIGSFLGRWANYVFIAVGGLMFLIGALIESFAIWPLLEPIGGIREASVRLFESEMSRFMSFTFRVAGPIMVTIFVIDVAMGLINRYAQQFNVFFLSMSLKSMATILMVILLLPFLVGVLVQEVAVQATAVEQRLERILERR